MPNLEWLEQHMQHCDTFAERLYRQFSYEYADISLEEWQHEFTEGQRNGDWQCLIALQDDRLLGGAALARDDLPGRPELGPWLACVLVEPQARGQGLAEKLIEGICQQARERGVATLYLHTHDQSAYYAKRGWSVREQFQAWGKAQWLMSRELLGQ